MTMIGLLFIGGAVALLARFVLDLISSILSTSWPSAPGRVTASRVDRSGGGEGLTYRGVVSYTYTVNGIDHTAERVRWGDQSGLGWVWPARAIVKRYPVGRAVMVRYNPHDHGEAVLEPGLSWFVVWGIVMALALIVSGVFALRSRT